MNLNLLQLNSSKNYPSPKLWLYLCTECYIDVLYTLDEHCVPSGMFVSVLTMVCRPTGAQRVYDHTPSHCSISILR